MKHNNLNVPNATELTFKSVKMLNLVLCMFHNFFFKENEVLIHATSR